MPRRKIWGKMGGTIITPTIWERRINLARAIVGMVVAKATERGNRWNGGGNINIGGNSWKSGNSGGGGGKHRPYNVKLYNNNNYCWSHGNDLPSDHNSTNCNHQCPNHCTMATATNNMAGNPKNQESTIWPSASGWPEITPRQLRNQNGNGNQGGQQGNMMKELQKMQMQMGMNMMKQQQAAAQAQVPTQTP